jgi:hypothetical protein
MERVMVSPAVTAELPVITGACSEVLQDLFLSHDMRRKIPIVITTDTIETIFFIIAT